jgi:GPI mannosyltransferase 2
MQPTHSQVLRVAIISRGMLLVLCVLADHLLPDHQAQGVVHFVEPVSRWLRTFTKWDAAHYLNIASKRGSRDEMELAFMPLFPHTVEIIADFLSSIAPMTRGDSLVCAGLILNSTCFVLSSLILMKLLKQWGVKGKLMLVTLLLHLFNPANVFFVTIYTESLYSLASWTGILLLERKNYLLASFPLLIASSTRVNGILNVVFPSTLLLKCFGEGSSPLVKTQLLLCLSPAFLATCLPYFSLDRSIHDELCRISVPYTKKSEGCAGGSFLFYGAYSYVQKKFWGVGLLEYYQLKQLPNFLLALPIFVAASFTLLSRHKLIGSSASFLRQAHFIHLFLNLLLITFWAHVQISTRLLCSASPVLYVGVAHVLQSLEDRGLKNEWRAALVVLLIYNILGSILHVNFFPFT